MRKPHRDHRGRARAPASLADISGHRHRQRPAVPADDGFRPALSFSTTPRRTLILLVGVVEDGSFTSLSPVRIAGAAGGLIVITWPMIYSPCNLLKARWAAAWHPGPRRLPAERAASRRDHITMGERPGRGRRRRVRRRARLGPPDIRERVSPGEGLRKRRRLSCRAATEVQRPLGEIARSIVRGGRRRRDAAAGGGRLKSCSARRRRLTLTDDDAEPRFPWSSRGTPTGAGPGWPHASRWAVASTAWRRHRQPAADNYLADPRPTTRTTSRRPACSWARSRSPRCLARRGGDRHAGHHLRASARPHRPARRAPPAGLAGRARSPSQRAPAEQLRDSEHRYRRLVDNSPDLFWSVDADGAFTYLGESPRAHDRLPPGGAAGPAVRGDQHPAHPLGGRTAWRAMQRIRRMSSRFGWTCRWPVVGPWRSRSAWSPPWWTAVSPAPTDRSVTFVSASGWSRTCAARPRRWLPTRNAPTWRASCTTRSRRRCSAWA